MKRILLAAALALLAGAAATAWLGPEAIGWSLRAALRPAPVERTWSHVPADAPGVGTLDLRRLLSSPIGRELRPELETLAGLQGADLGWFEQRLDAVVVVHDGDATGYALGSPFRFSPLLATSLGERWGHVQGAGIRGASDGLLALFPLEPGLVLATEPSAAGRALQLAAPASPGHVPLRLDEPGLALRARLAITAPLRLRLRRQADPRALPLLEALESAELSLTALDELDALLALSCRDASSAEAVETTLRQLDAVARAARQAGGLATALFGRTGALLRDLPAMEIAREGEVVRVRAAADAEGLRPWLRRAIEAVAAH